MQHMIIGMGPAGVVAAETLRKLDPSSSITLIGDEPEPPYSRMAIPYLLQGSIEERGTYLRKGQGHFERLRIEVQYARVTQVQPADGNLTLADGRQLSYDKLLIATGSHPVAPAIPGIDSASVYSCWTLGDARHILRLTPAGATVVLIGAGFIGCIILEALASRGVNLTVVEMADRVVARMMNARSAELIKRWCESKGIKILTATQVQGIESTKGRYPLKLGLSSGENLAADLVITATGVRPNIEFLNAAGLELDDGIVVNEYLQTSHPNIFAAGDVAQGKDFSTGEYSVQAIQPTAADHGRIAASNMAGRKNRHRGSINMNVLDTMGLISSSFGLWMGADGGESAELYDPERYRYLNLQFDDDRLIGASSLGLTEHIGVLRGLLQSRIRLGEWKDRLQQDPTRLMEAYLANTQAIGHNAGLI